ncbi:sigma-70 family RNA polymerase sigma factor [Anaerobacillus alkaliphilus]|uniref:Sigma-70 family RNA polymerase sigma factor n=1 Tax=Anaerobacillus alkaliphilus TaxID=1548597 RepID=A0A4Q0VNS6_9BACI|nr:sigma-70 family RNA polymerase sigma factor [Anaerobacillus alkaliphilus]RXI96676.1 sigma-70 family RNA polymerase sigma factor [Anaerobacillus alkaliphilus]
MSEQLDEKLQDHTSWYKNLKKFSCYVTNSKWDAEDVVQEAALKLFESQRSTKLNIHSLPSSYLKKTIKHLTIDHIRKNSRIQITDLEGTLTPDTRTGYENVLALSQYLVSNLTEMQVKVFLLKEVFYYQVNEIAELLQMTEYAVKSMLRRARVNLRRKDQDEEESLNSSILVNLVAKSIRLNNPWPLLTTARNQVKSQFSQRTEENNETVIVSHNDGQGVVQIISKGQTRVYSVTNPMTLQQLAA